MGLQQGERLSRLARQAIGAVLASPYFEIARPRCVPRRWFPKLAAWRARQLIEKGIRRHYRRQYDRAVAIAEAAALPVERIWLCHAVEIDGARPGLQIPACSSVALAPERTAFGEPLIAKNFDYLPETQPFNILRRNAPQGRLGSLDLSFPTLAGSHDGLNERGLAIAYNYGYPADKSRPRLPITLLVQEVLERCSTVAEAVDLISKLPRRGGALLTLADAGGSIASIELTSRRCAVRPADDGIVMNTNHYHCEQTKAVDAAFGRFAWRWQRGRHWMGPSSQCRFDRLAELARARRRWDIDDLVGLLSDHGPDGQGSVMTVCRHPPPFATTVSMIILPVRREIHLAAGNACEHSFVACSL